MYVFICPHHFLQICKKKTKQNNQQVNIWSGQKSLTLYLHLPQQNHSWASLLLENLSEGRMDRHCIWEEKLLFFLQCILSVDASQRQHSRLWRFAPNTLILDAFEHHYRIQFSELLSHFKSTELCCLLGNDSPFRPHSGNFIPRAISNVLLQIGSN